MSAIAIATFAGAFWGSCAGTILGLYLGAKIMVNVLKRDLEARSR